MTSSRHPLERVLRSKGHMSSDSVVPFAHTTAKNLMVSRARRQERHRGYAHRLGDADISESPVEVVLEWEAGSA